MQLKKNQIRFIEVDLGKRGVHYPPLKEDLVDHICTEVENRMENGVRFKDAYNEALDLFLPAELSQIQNKTVKTLTNMTLVKSYTQTAYRSILNNKGHTLINVFGLTASLAICILIFLFIRYELSYDQQHPNSNIHRLTTKIKRSDGQISNTAFTGAPWGPALVNDFPEILDAARIMKYRLDVLVSKKDENIAFYESDLIWGDQQLLDFFAIEMINGDKKNALTEPNSVVLSEKTAKKYFGDTEPIGKVLTYNNEVDLTVTGVIQNMPENMHFKGDLICSFNTLRSFWRIIDNWSILYYYTYLQIQEGVDVESIEDKFPDFFERRIGGDWNLSRSAHLQDVREVHFASDVNDELKAGTNLQYLFILGGIATIILLLACSNFVNLNLARSLKRTKELGIRKVMGGQRIDLILQYILESGLLTIFSLLLALLLAQLLLPFFNDLLGKELSIFGKPDLLLIGYIAIIIVLISVTAGGYPALRLANLKTIPALKGKGIIKIGNSSFGDGLMLFQFAICTTLIVAIAIIKLQQNFIANKNLGFSSEQMLVISTNDVETNELSLVKQELLSIPEIQNVSITSHKLVGDQPYFGSYIFSGLDRAPDTLGLGRLHIDESFIETYSLNLVAGRDYNSKIRSDTASFLVNEKTASLLGVSPDQAIGLTINYITQGENRRYPRTGKIIGVVEDFHFQSLHQEIGGMVMDIQHPRAHFIACKLAKGVPPTVTSKIEASIKPFAPNTPLDYFFMDDQFENLYKKEKMLDILITIASFVAIAIAFLGLLGLVSQLTIYKKREIGIRKVLGADTKGITLLLSNKYLKIILSSFVLAFPVSYFWMNEWLQNYPYRVDFPFALIPIAGLLIVFSALLTIGVITKKAANANPIAILKED